MKNKNVLLLSLSLLVIFISNYFGTEIFQLPKHYFLMIFASIIVIAISFKILIKKRLNFQFNWVIFLFILLYLLSAVFSVLFSNSPELSFFGNYKRLQGGMNAIFYIVFFLAFLSAFKKRANVETFLKILMFFAGITVFHGVLQQFNIANFGMSSSQEFGGRSFATLGHPVYFGQFLIFPIWSAIYFFLKEKARKPKILWLFIAIIFFVALLLTRNRASILGVSISILVFGFIRLRISTLRKFSLLAITIVAFMLYIHFFSPTLRSLESRFVIWKTIMHNLPHNLLFGVGLEGIKSYFQAISPKEIFTLEPLYSVVDRSHNLYLDILVMRGLFGLVAFASGALLLFTKVTKTLRKNHTKNLLYISSFAITSLSLSLFFSFPLTVDFLLISAFLAILVNQIFSFYTVRLNRNFLTIFLSIIAITVSIFTINFSFKAVASDINLFYGYNDLENDDFSDAIKFLEDGRRQNPHQDDVFFSIINLLINKAKNNPGMDLYNETELFLDDVGRFTNYNYRYLYLTGRLKNAQKKFDEAEKYYNLSLDKAPLNPIALRQLGVNYFEKRDYRNTIKVFNYHLGTLPDYWKWKLSYDSISDEKKWKYIQFINGAPDFWSIFNYLSQAYLNTDDEETAIFYLQYAKDGDSKTLLERKLNHHL